MSDPQIFRWTPLLGAAGTTAEAVKSVAFGDGYDQVAQDGIHNRKDTWPLSFIGSEEKIREISDFLDWHAGAKSFYWTPPLRGAGRFRASNRSVTPNGNGIYTLAVTFTETFAP